MASTYKTPAFGLNQWLGGDRPKREDFNHDNTAIESALLAHVNDAAVHLGGDLEIGSYTGDDTGPRAIALAEKPRVLIVYAVQQVPAHYYPDPGCSAAYMAVATALGGSAGLQLTDTGFTVTNPAQAAPGGRLSRMNAAGVSYVYIAIP